MWRNGENERRCIRRVRGNKLKKEGLEGVKEMEEEVDGKGNDE